MDGRTPPLNAEALLPGFSNGTHLLVNGASHDDELWLGNPDIAARISDFLAGRAVSDAELDVPPPAFAKSKFELLAGMLGVGTGTVMAALAMLVALLLAAFVLLRRWHRKVRARNGLT